ncbi:MAG: helix-turn-helix domain-containing protein [Candidatus Omnitrophota bacterium]
MDSRGARLKKIRLEKGLNLEEAHKKTKIHLNVLKAIEEDSFINLSPIYIHGFLKIYCEFLEVNPDDYISDYKEKPQISAGLAKSKEEELPRRQASLKLIPSAAALKLKKVFILILGILFIIAALAIAKNILSKFKFNLPKKSLNPATANLPIKKTSLQSKLVDAAGKKISIPLSKVKKAEINKSGKKEGISIVGVSLSVYAKEDCYVDVRLDGKLIFKNILKKDNRESWKAKEKIELSLGNAGGVDLEVNGKVLPALGRRGQIVKNILITKDTLDIPR